MEDGIYRVEKNEDYVTICNRPLRDKNLSWGARGILAYLLTKPDNWQVRSEDIIAQYPGNKRDAVLRMLKELETYGYLYRERVRTEIGTYCWQTRVYETPERNPYFNANSPKSENPTQVKPTQAEPKLDLPTQVNPTSKEVLNRISTDLSSNSFANAQLLEDAAPTKLTENQSDTNPPTLQQQSPVAMTPTEGATSQVSGAAKSLQLLKPKKYVWGSIVSLEHPVHVACRKACHVKEGSTDKKKREVEEAASVLIEDGKWADDVEKFITNYWRYKFMGAYWGKAPTAQNLRDDFDIVLDLEVTYHGNDGPNDRSERSRKNTITELEGIASLRAIGRSMANPEKSVCALPVT